MVRITMTGPKQELEQTVDTISQDTRGLMLLEVTAPQQFAGEIWITTLKVATYQVA